MPGSSFKRFFVKAGTIADGVRDDADGEAGGETAAGATISGAAGLESAPKGTSTTSPVSENDPTEPVCPELSPRRRCGRVSSAS